MALQQLISSPKLNEWSGTWHKKGRDRWRKVRTLLEKEARKEERLDLSVSNHWAHHSYLAMNSLWWPCCRSVADRWLIHSGIPWLSQFILPSIEVCIKSFFFFFLILERRVGTARACTNQSRFRDPQDSSHRVGLQCLEQQTGSEFWWEIISS